MENWLSASQKTWAQLSSQHPHCRSQPYIPLVLWGPDVLISVATRHAYGVQNIHMGKAVIYIK